MSTPSISVAEAVDMAQRAQKAEGRMAERLRVIDVERRHYKRALEYLTDRESWLGDPHSQESTLHGHDTPYELALAALDLVEQGSA